MSIVLFWMGPNGTAAHQEFGPADLGPALKAAEERRGAGMRHVCISSELSDSVGKPGVTAVENGLLPDGHVYDFNKAHRGAGPGSERPGRRK